MAAVFTDGEIVNEFIMSRRYKLDEMMRVVSSIIICIPSPRMDEAQIVYNSLHVADHTNSRTIFLPRRFSKTRVPSHSRIYEFSQRDAFNRGVFASAGLHLPGVAEYRACHTTRRYDPLMLYRLDCHCGGWLSSPARSIRRYFSCGTFHGRNIGFVDVHAPGRPGRCGDVGTL